MTTVVLDTNVLLDIFVFNDFRAIPIKQRLLDDQLDALATPKTIDELADVISRPLFSLDFETQKKIVAQWSAIARILPDNTLSTAPWQCQDPDDQVFLNLAYSAKPCLLISKDHEILKIANKAAKEGIIISPDYKLTS